MRNIIIILFTIFSIGATVPYSTIKYWNEQDKLKWSDFQREPDTTGANKKFSAAVCATLYHESQFMDENTMRIIVRATLDRKESWYKPEFCDDYILNHEQVHFDIAEVFARKLRWELLTYNGSCVEYLKLKKIVSNVFERYKKELDDCQTLYDDETYHAQISEEQIRWNGKVWQELNLLNDYKSDTIFVNMTVDTVEFYWRSYIYDQKQKAKVR